MKLALITTLLALTGATQAQSDNMITNPGGVIASRLLGSPPTQPNVNTLYNNFQNISQRDELYRPFRFPRRERERVVRDVAQQTSTALATIPSFGSPPAQQCVVGENSNDEVEATPLQSRPDDRFPPLHSSFRGLGADCSQYIQADGSYGPLGQTLVDSIRDRGADSIFYSQNAPDYQNWCPNWQNLSSREKEHFWVWTVTAIVHAESTCRRGRIRVRGTNGTAVGPMQMELEAHLNRARASSEHPHPNCVGPTLRGPQPDLLGSHENNIRCGLDVLEKQLNTGVPLYRTDSRSGDIYWQKLRRRNGGAIGNMIRQNPNCVLE